MIQFFLFFIVSIFNGVEDIEWQVDIFTNVDEMSKNYCMSDKLVWACTDGYNRSIYMLVGALKLDVRCINYKPCSVLQHEMTHAELFEKCIIYEGLFPYINTDYCTKFSNWHG